jgi:DNA modification methylase
LADNRAGELSTWDDDILKDAIKSLHDINFDVGEIGFDLKDFDFGESDLDFGADDIPEVEQNARGVKRGDIWLLGEHRLMCGDSTSESEVAKLMNGEKVDMVYTDPPYGIDEETNRDFASRTRLAKVNNFKKIIGDKDTETAMKSINISRSLGAKCNIFWGGNYYSLPPSPNWIVWDKRVEEKQKDMNSDCELAYVEYKKTSSVRIFRHLWKGMIKASEHGQGRVHPTQKPIALAEWCFESYGDSKLVLDLFLGSGSTLIACEKTKRRCFGMEIDPHYCSVIIQRWEDFTGNKAHLTTS